MPEIETTEHKKLYKPISQKEAGYIPLHTTPDQACSNCRYYQFDLSGFSACALIENHPDPVIQNGWCNRWEAEPAPTEASLGTPMPVVIVELDEVKEQAELETALRKPGVLERLLKAIKGIGQPDMRGGFEALDDHLWVGWWSNNFEDREAEIISQKATDRYIARADTRIVPLPDLRYWHIPGSEHGKALFVGRIDHMNVAIGTFDETELGQTFAKHYQGRKYAMSCGFRADRTKHFIPHPEGGGVWTDYNVFEISPLPLKAAANPFTLFTEVKAMLTPEKLAALEAIVGKEQAATIVQKSKDWSKEIEALGVNYKDYTDVEALQNPSQAAQALDDIQKSAGELLVEIAESQGTMVSLMTAVDARQKTAEDALVVLKDVPTILTSLDARLKKLETDNAQAPRRASTDDKTKLTPEEAKEYLDEVKEVDHFWGDAEVSAEPAT